MSTVARPKMATALDLATLPEDLRAEVVGGEIVQKAAPSFEHSDAQGALNELLRPPFQRGSGGPGGWWIAPEVEIELETHEVYLPDVAGWRRDRVPERPKGRPIRVRPDWVAEVLSPTTAKRDLGPKLRAYHRGGVPHYWIIDAQNEMLTVYRWSQEGYVVHLTAGRSDRVKAAPFEEIEIEIAQLFGG